MDWKYSTEGISNFPGVIGATAGVIMWVTALAPVRSRFFNFFYGTHQLYIVLFVFYAWHVGKGNMGKCIGGIFLFFIDRFLRFVQSQKRITGVTAQVLPSGVVELKIPIQQGAFKFTNKYLFEPLTCRCRHTILRVVAFNLVNVKGSLSFTGFEYNALSFMYINVPGISRLEWHPFSSASSSLNISDTISICIKPLGDWTYSLHSAILDNLASLSMDPKLECPFALKLYTEGPYGHESDYFLRYLSSLFASIHRFMSPIESSK